MKINAYFYRLGMANFVVPQTLQTNQEKGMKMQYLLRHKDLTKCRNTMLILQTQFY